MTRELHICILFRYRCDLKCSSGTLTTAPESCPPRSCELPGDVAEPYKGGIDVPKTRARNAFMLARNHGDNRMVVPPSGRGDYMERIGRQIEIHPIGCWLWTGPTNDGGYGTTPLGPAHRVVYETIKSYIPEGMVAHHVCETKRCVNPDHIEPMTHADHMKHHAQLRKERAATSA